MLDYNKILEKTLVEVDGIKPIIDYWPSAEKICQRLSALVLDVIPDPYGDMPSMLHRSLIMGVSKWEAASEENDVDRFKAFNDGLIKPLTELMDYRVIAIEEIGELAWDPFHDTLYNFCCSYGAVRVIKMEYRADERFVINQRFLSFLMASRVLSMGDVIALQALPSRSLLSFC